MCLPLIHYHGSFEVPFVATTGAGGHNRCQHYRTLRGPCIFLPQGLYVTRSELCLKGTSFLITWTAMHTMGYMINDTDLYLGRMPMT